ncbi:MAG TPA: hypothetical protein VGL23_06710 [Chloroflexota bacterium]
MRSLLVTALALSLVACGGTTSGQPAASPLAAQAASPTARPTNVVATPTNVAATPTGVAATPTSVAAAPVNVTATPINVDDMMGLYPQQTVFVAAADHVAAVTLLNHFTRYRIATNGLAQVSTDSTGQWLYLLDAEAPGLHRLRVFDVPSGTERARQAGIAGVAAEGRRVLVAATAGRVLVLKSDPRHARVDAYDALTLRPLGAVADTLGCGDRLLASVSRIAVVCLSTGQITLDDLRGNHAAVEGALPNLVAAAMADDGMLYVATADQHLATVAAGAAKLVSVPWPSEWSGTVLADGLAVAQSGASGLIAERTEDGAWLRVFATKNMAQRTSLRLAGTPQGGVLTLWPFAYYTVDRTVRHVDLTSGLLETMTEVGTGAVPGAVVNG